MVKMIGDHFFLMGLLSQEPKNCITETNLNIWENVSFMLPWIKSNIKDFPSISNEKFTSKSSILTTVPKPESSTNFIPPPPQEYSPKSPLIPITPSHQGNMNTYPYFMSHSIANTLIMLPIFPFVSFIVLLKYLS